MSRVSGWRVRCPDAVRALQGQVVDGGVQLFLVHQTGPTGFLVKEQKKRLPLRVHLGDPHTCTCRLHRMSQDLCLHICWTLLRKLRLMPEDPLSFQLGLLPRELSSLLFDEKKASLHQPIGTKVIEKASNESAVSVPRRPITPNVACPICLEELLEKKKPVTHCRHGCGNPVHISCMKILAEHQIEDSPLGTSTLTCPLCRGDFCSWAELLEEVKNAPSTDYKVGPRRSATTGRIPKVATGPHSGIKCSGCLTSPVLGRLYRCAQCHHLTLCESCSTDPGIRNMHRNHGLIVKENPGGRWRTVSPSWLERTETPRCVPGPGRRTKSTGTRETLRRCLDEVYKRFADNREAEDEEDTCLDAALLTRLPTWRVRSGSRLLLKGQQCCLCLSPYKAGQSARGLPCGHQFHSNCISGWLVDKCARCPLDGADVGRVLMQRALQSQIPPAEPGSPRSLSVGGKEAEGAGKVPLEVSVRRVNLADRRLATTSGRNSVLESRRPSFVAKSEDVGVNRWYPLPARPLLCGLQRNPSGSVSPSVRTPSPADQGQSTRREVAAHGGARPMLTVNSLELRLDDVTTSGAGGRRRRRGAGCDGGGRRRRGREEEEDPFPEPGGGREDGSVPQDVIQCLRVRLSQKTGAGAGRGVCRGVQRR